MLIMNTQNSSDVSTLQMIGRVLRKYPDKTNAIIINIEILGYSQFERAGARRRELFDKIAGERHKVIRLGEPT